MALKIFDEDDLLDDHFANFWFEYHENVVQTEPKRIFGSKNECNLSKKENKQINRGWYKKGRFEIGINQRFPVNSRR